MTPNTWNSTRRYAALKTGLMSTIGARAAFVSYSTKRQMHSGLHAASTISIALVQSRKLSPSVTVISGTVTASSSSSQPSKSMRGMREMPFWSSADPAYCGLALIALKEKSTKPNPTAVNADSRKKTLDNH